MKNVIFIERERVLDLYRTPSTDAIELYTVYKLHYKSRFIIQMNFIDYKIYDCILKEIFHLQRRFYNVGPTYNTGRV